MQILYECFKVLKKMSSKVIICKTMGMAHVLTQIYEPEDFFLSSVTNSF